MRAAEISGPIIAWYTSSARELPWREPGVSAWAILVSEFMLQQTQVDRVLPRWQAWLERWPTPQALAGEEPGEAVRAWDRLGYPRRALWLHRAAVEITERHGGIVPAEVEDLLALTGIGPYTARAVAAFAYGERHPVVDTNTRRVIARAVHGRAAAGIPAQADLADMSALLPGDPADAALFNAGAMELGAVVCTARAPRCGECPIADLCEWRGAGYPDNAPEKRLRQARFEGSDRQARGRVLALLRRATGPVARTEAITAAADDPAQAQRAVDSLLADGLLVLDGPGPDRLRLP
ncbi:A/G-specific adenine glycosylase [Leucobacter sp. CSA2]|uniref:Adenine DNA glycosylase n=1 Tax=Leucobacter edaphi TaxID=2796472 RepID=A0A934QEJ3_9MICO|nr:A/G-specific adenine glycosylase [Leucobacter edaphi]MBK0422395.1 A/G-specific adenine glycosylase [Leucobacter edaphi]